MGDVLIVGDTEHSAELRHEIPVAIGDAFLYAEVDGRRVAVVWSVEGDRITQVDPSVEIVPTDGFPLKQLLEEVGGDPYALWPAACVRRVRALGIRRAHVPATFPTLVADALRADGVELLVDTTRSVTSPSSSGAPSRATADARSTASRSRASC